MDYSYLCILLLLVSLALLVLEVFIPSGGFVSLLMLAALGGSVVCAYNAWWETSRGIWWGYLAAILVLLPSVLIGAFAIFPRTRYGRRILLEAPKSEEITPYAKEQSELNNLIGKTAVAVTPHRPSGLIDVEGKRYHSETRGMMLETNDLVEIVAVRGNRLLVRLSDGPADATSSTSEADQPEPRASEPTPKPRRDQPFDPFLDESDPA